VAGRLFDDGTSLFNAPTFERLTRGQKQLAILLAATALLDPVAQPPEITAVSISIEKHSSPRWIKHSC
jgi:hypothetical protein